MTFLLPWGLVGLFGVPVLVWLWRWSASRHRTVVSSLIPFEHLLRRSPARRARPIVNVLFWLQAAALALAALALAGPALRQTSSRTVLVILDTSASTGATLGGPTPFARAREALLRRLARRRWRERFFIMTTSPLAPLLPAPSSDTLQLQHAINRLEPAALDGNLTMALRVGASLLRSAADEILVLTDEPPPQHPAAGGSTAGAAPAFRSFGAPLPNAAIVGVDTHASLCTAGQPNLVVTVQNFSDQAQTVGLTVRRGSRVVSAQQLAMAAQARMPVRLDLPDAGRGPLDILITPQRDALAVDNHAAVQLQPSSELPILVVSSRPEVVQLLGRWMDACARLRWEAVDSDAQLPATLRAASRRDPATILVTDQPTALAQWTGPAVLFGGARGAPRARIASWLVEPSHPIGEYLQPLETAGVAFSPVASADGEPVIWTLVDGRRVPLVQAAAAHGRRVVTIHVDPLSIEAGAPPLIVFLNSLRWLSASLGFATTGDTLSIGPLDPGLVQVRRPRGPSVTLAHPGGMLSYDGTDHAGRYQFLASGGPQERLVNFINPVESNLMTRVSTWSPDAASLAAPDRPHPITEPVAGPLLWLVLLLWLAEWLLYGRRRARGAAR